ncbi:cryptochrome/photolyase family protein [Carnobacterium gallinarum]|uniref:cryptochrome/photolyase family protein n=1 Tax=Carnobacterium gallinarum TaxID=2749 RepID=UPI0005529E14|nr:deoxyribodipyrimidine photo-lyase [Carnobacterium gallinarum]
MNITGFLFRKDLRLTDNTALIEALSIQQNKTDSLVAIFHLNPQQFKPNSMNHAYFFSAVAQFSKVAEAAGFPIHFIYGDLETAFTALKEQLPKLTKLYYNQDQRGFGRERDQKMEALLANLAIDTYSFQDSHLHGVTDIRKQDGTAFKVFTPYYNKWKQLEKPRFQKINQEQLAQCSIDQRQFFQQGQEQLEKLTAVINPIWLTKVGASVARKQLSHFIQFSVEEYHVQRDSPSIDGTSRLSQYLRTGEISIREVYHRVNQEATDTEGKATYIKELCWRDFYNMIYFENPQQNKLEIQKKYRQLSWNQNQSFLEAWKNGATGFPLVDAAMKQLNQTGWMHNRLRMVVASFLVKDLLIDWREGEAYFAQQLIDYDAASNIGGWQWAASTGTDAVPYFRIFNPTTQSQRFDKDGLFIRQYLPVLEQVPLKYLHEPSKMPSELQQKLQIKIGEDYPFPIVEHAKMRQEAIDMFKGY